HLQITGVDISEASLAHARRNLAGESVTLLRASAEHLPFADGSFDAAIFIWVLEHVPDPAAVMRDVARCLRPGGRLLAVEVYNQTLLAEPRKPAIDAYFATLSELQARHGGHPNIAPRLPELAARVGLDLVEFRVWPAIGDSRDPVARE